VRASPEDMPRVHLGLWQGPPGQPHQGPVVLHQDEHEETLDHRQDSPDFEHIPARKTPVGIAQHQRSILIHKQFAGPRKDLEQGHRRRVIAVRGRHGDQGGQ
jgi:hypothetical protein